MTPEDEMRAKRFMERLDVRAALADLLARRETGEVSAVDPPHLLDERLARLQADRRHTIHKGDT